MATIGTRINENGEEEIIITNINNDLNGLISAIDEFRKDAPFSRKKVFITESLIINEQIIDRDIKFSNCVFEEIVHFERVEFAEIVDFERAIFQDYIDFNEVVFKKNTYFSGVTFQGIYMKEVEFSKEVKFFTAIFQNTADFINVNFKEKVTFHKSSFQNITYFSENIFKQKTIFLSTIFQDNTYFQSCEFQNIIFSKTIFNKSVDFSSSTFLSPQTFYSTNFMDTANFANTTFEQEAQFTSCKVDSKTLISFQCATFKKGLDISTSNFNLCKVNFLGIKIKNINEALSSKFYVIRLDDTKQFLSVHHRFRETFRFIKNSLYAENNQIEGLEFYKKEMEVYGKELESKGDEYWQEKIILWFNKMSNNYGTNWLRGVGFTAVWALVILGIILGITTLENSGITFNLCDLDAWKQTIKAYIEVINIAKWTDIKPLGYELSGFGLFFLFVGRIFIGYGYYQTIQAFRKYGK